MSSGGGDVFGLSGVSVPSVGVPPLGVQSLLFSFSPWVSSLVSSSSPWSFSPALVSSVASVSSVSVSLACNVGFPRRPHWLWVTVRRLLWLLVRLLRCLLFWLQFQRLSPLLVCRLVFRFLGRLLR